MARYSWLPLLAAPLVAYAALVVWSDAQKVASNVLSVDAGVYLAFAGLWSGGVLLRVVRWHAYMRVIEPRITFRRNAVYFLSGFSMLLSPGRVGEVIRSPLIKRDYGTPVSKTAAAVFVERFYDALASVSIIAAALAFADVPRTVLAVPLLVLGVLLALVLNRGLLARMVRRARGIRGVGRMVPDPDESLDTAFALLGPKSFAASTALTGGVVALEAAAFYLLLSSLGVSLDFATVTAVFHTSSFLGAVSFIPAGLGVVEGGLSGLLLLYGVPEDVGLAASVLMRIVATGLFTAVGIACLRAASGRR